MSDFLDEKYREITERSAELAPLVDEYTRLQAAAAALETMGGSPAAMTHATQRAKRGPGRPRGSRSKSRNPDTENPRTRAKKRRSSAEHAREGTRTAQALELIVKQPGITIPELAAAMKIQQSYLYRVLPGLQSNAKVERRGRGWHPRGS